MIYCKTIKTQFPTVYTSVCDVSGYTPRHTAAVHGHVVVINRNVLDVGSRNVALCDSTTSTFAELQEEHCTPPNKKKITSLKLHQTGLEC